MEIYFLYFILILASIIDFKTYTIPNYITFGTVVTGFIYSFVFFGVNGLIASLVSVLFVFITFLILWIIRVMGAGDVKLFMGIASFLGFAVTLKIAFYAIFIASILFVFILSPKRIIQMFQDFIYLIFYKIPLISKRNSKRLPFSIPIFLGFILVTTFII